MNNARSATVPPYSNSFFQERFAPVSLSAQKDLADNSSLLYLGESHGVTHASTRLRRGDVQGVYGCPQIRRIN